MHVAQLRGVRREPEQERRADVVRKVADDAQVGAERCVVELERVGFVQRERGGREVRAQARREVAVDLDRGHVSGARDELAGQRGEPRPDLDDPVARLRRDRIDDAADVVRIGQEVLPEPLARAMAFHGTPIHGERV